MLSAVVVVSTCQTELLHAINQRGGVKLQCRGSDAKVITVTDHQHLIPVTGHESAAVHDRASKTDDVSDVLIALKSLAVAVCLDGVEPFQPWQGFVHLIIVQMINAVMPVDALLDQQVELSHRLECVGGPS